MVGWRREETRVLGGTDDHSQLSHRKLGDSDGCFCVFINGITVLSLDSIHSRYKGLVLRRQGGDSFA